MEAGSATPSPGWYPDPEKPGLQRWWNGVTWANPDAPLPGGTAKASANGPSVAPSPITQRSGLSGFAFWGDNTFIGVGGIGLVIAAVLFFTHSGPFQGVGEQCIITAMGGNKLCGADAKAWCDSTDRLRAMDPQSSTDSQAACDNIRGK